MVVLKRTANFAVAAILIFFTLLSKLGYGIYRLPEDSKLTVYSA